MILRDSPEMVWRAAGLSVFAITAVFSLLPDAGPPGSTDKLVHVLVYALIGALLARGSWTRVGAIVGALIAAAGGVVIEWLQGFVGREPSVTDALANLAGALIGALAAARHVAVRLNSRRKRRRRRESAAAAASTSFPHSESDVASS